MSIIGGLDVGTTGCKISLYDENANYLSRTSAIDIVKAHCSEEQFNSLEEIVNSLTDKKAAIVKSSYESKKKTN